MNTLQSSLDNSNFGGIQFSEFKHNLKTLREGLKKFELLWFLSNIEIRATETRL